MYKQCLLTLFIYILYKSAEIKRIIIKQQFKNKNGKIFFIIDK